MGFLTRQDIIGARDLPYQDEIVPEWPDSNGESGMVRLHRLQAGDIIKLTNIMSNRPKSDGMFVMFVFCAHDDQGNRLFPFTNDEEFEQAIAELRTKSMEPLDRLQRVAMRLNGMLPEQLQQLKNRLGEAASAARPTTSPISSVA